MLLRALANFPRTRRDLPLSWSSRDNDSREGAPLGGSLDPRRGRGLVGIAKHAEPVEDTGIEPQSKEPSWWGDIPAFLTPGPQTEFCTCDGELLR
jgi:hypothetical protein